MKVINLDKFAVDEFSGKRMLTSVGCTMRHKLPRDEQHYTRKEENRKFNCMGNGEYYKENRLIGKAHQLKSMGLTPDPNMELEDWVAQYEELING